MDSDDRTVIAKGASSSEVSNYDLRVAGGKVRFLFRNPSDSWKAYSTVDPVLTADRWTHVVVVHVWGDPGSTKIYVDGEEKGGMWIAGNGSDRITANTEPLYISGTGLLRGFNGLIDEVSVYRRALTSDEVMAHYEEMAGTSAPAGGEESGFDYGGFALWVGLLAVVIAVSLIVILRRRKREPT